MFSEELKTAPSIVEVKSGFDIVLSFFWRDWKIVFKPKCPHDSYQIGPIGIWFCWKYDYILEGNIGEDNSK